MVRPADAAQAVQVFYTLIDEQVARLEELLAMHEELTSDEATALADRASFDGSAGGERLRRTQTARGRELRQRLELLMKMQRAESNGQAAYDGGNAKDGEKPVAETPAAKVAASSEETREPGSMAKPVARERRKDKYQSRAALEIVMSQRLAEQAIDMLFENPPEALAALKGSPKLAELKVLPGRAPVQARRASESTAGEPGMKNASIEAKCQEMQIVEGQRDSGHNPESGGENQSHLRDEDSLGR